MENKAIPFILGFVVAYSTSWVMHVVYWAMTVVAFVVGMKVGHR